MNNRNDWQESGVHPAAVVPAILCTTCVLIGVFVGVVLWIVNLIGH